MTKVIKEFAEYCPCQETISDSKKTGKFWDKFHKLLTVQPVTIIHYKENTNMLPFVFSPTSHRLTSIHVLMSPHNAWQLIFSVGQPEHNLQNPRGGSALFLRQNQRKMLTLTQQKVYSEQYSCNIILTLQYSKLIYSGTTLRRTHERQYRESTSIAIRLFKAIPRI